MEKYLDRDHLPEVIKSKSDIKTFLKVMYGQTLLGTSWEDFSRGVLTVEEQVCCSNMTRNSTAIKEIDVISFADYRTWLEVFAGILNKKVFSRSTAFVFLRIYLKELTDEFNSTNIDFSKGDDKTEFVHVIHGEYDAKKKSVKFLSNKEAKPMNTIVLSQNGITKIVFLYTNGKTYTATRVRKVDFFARDMMGADHVEYNCHTGTHRVYKDELAGITVTYNNGVVSSQKLSDKVVDEGASLRMPNPSVKTPRKATSKNTKKRNRKKGGKKK